MIQLRLGRVLLGLLGACAFALVFWPRLHAHRSAEQQWQAWDGLAAIENQTLGFGKVFAINMPSRVDKRDNIVLGSSVCDFLVDWIDGVFPEEVNSKTFPYNWNQDHKASEYAARRAHVNGMKRIVEDRIGSAIIMEDDADWDVNIKRQLQTFALSVRALQGTTGIPKTSPYGDDWDILWLGHCGIECKTELPFYLTPNDPTILEPRHFLPYLRDSPPFERPDHARLTCTAKDGVCTSMYAVSYHGAQRILAALSVNPSGLAEEIDIGAQFDVSLGRMCGNGYLRCFAPFPALTGGFRAAGAAEKGSDIHDQQGDAVGFASWGVLYSTMLNVKQILSGEPVRATWEDVEKPVLSDAVPIGRGSIYLKREDGQSELSSVAIDENQRSHRATPIRL
ncbi:hypothetical protein N7468_006494 [Penicillium chermesinum]|uniref:Glycosyltransferase family 25 protein n=1 Tax=Penicillium chermesinum TaxID=63820 RepID=A0A9W9NSG2_9EURO|nr:uncharacterized protein N7468_006494 [Penicillium chermesinum]KAJ5225269.1 hypothetical protein N7468_006494 [Penicillium chermesinum]KAJ6140578.1 hypothetical protein N7470_010374 [Penicillium chermesinum]